VSKATAGSRIGLRAAVQTGLVAGAVTVYLCAVGVFGRFEQRNIITGVITMGRTLLVLVAVIAGAVTARRMLRSEEGTGARSRVILLGALTGAVEGAVVAVLVLLTNAIEQSIFVNLGRGIVESLSLGLSVPFGAVVLIISGAVFGGLGALITALPSASRGPLIVGWVTVLGISLAEPLLAVILEGLGLQTDWLYQSGGLAMSGAIIVFVVAAGVAVFRAQRGDVVRERFERLPDQQRRLVRGGSILALIVVLALLPVIVGSFVSDVLGNVGLYVLLGLGLNIVVGYAGLLDLGYVAFFAVGAYTTAILTSTESFLVTDEATRFAESGPTIFWVALPITVVVAILIGVLIGAPVLRLRGDYLAIVTLGFGEIVRTLVLSDWLAPWLGGAQGLIQIPAAPPEALELRDPERLYYLILVFGLLAAYVCARLVGSRVGRAWAAMREDESVAEAMGVSVIKYKLLAFAMGAAVGCLGGAFFAIKLGSVFPSSFRLQVSINVLAVLVLGGMGSIRGVVVGAFVLVGLPDLLREFAEFRLLIFGAVLVAIMILRPEGLLPNVRRRRELHEKEVEEEQLEQRAGEPTPAAISTRTARPEPETP
jgi:branched-chain amino acid transport system permease protein